MFLSELTEPTEQRILDLQDAVLRVATVIATTAVEAGVLSDGEADDLCDEIADLIGVDLDDWSTPAERTIDDGLVA